MYEHASKGAVEPGNKKEQQAETLSLLETASVELLDTGGPFESVLPGFAPREEQLQLAAAIEKNIEVGGTLVAEAGSGSGKTLSYLVPVLMGRERTIISTGT